MTELLKIDEREFIRKFGEMRMNWERVFASKNFMRLMGVLGGAVRGVEGLDVLGEYLQKFSRGNEKWGIVRMEVGNKVGVKIMPEEFLLRESWELRRRYGLFVPDANKKGIQLGFMVNENRLSPFHKSPDRVVDNSGVWMGIVVEQINGFSKWRRGLKADFRGGVNLVIQNDGGVVWQKQGGGYSKCELSLPRGLEASDLLRLLKVRD